MSDYKDLDFVKMSKSHVEELYKLDRLCFNISWTKSMFYEELINEKALYFVALFKEQVVGYAGIWIILDEAQITNIAVHPDFRRLDIATTLLIKLIEQCNKNNIIQMTLEVRQSNFPAINLYEKHDFFKVGFRTKYYADNKEDAIIMTKKLT